MKATADRLKAAIEIALTIALILLCVAARNGRAAEAPNREGSLLAAFLAGPMSEVQAVVFAARGVNPTDGHWYANFGYYAHDPERKAYAEGTKLYRLNLRTRQVTALLEDPRGGVRDPQVHYEARKIVFSYRKGGTENSITFTKSTLMGPD